MVLLLFVSTETGSALPTNIVGIVSSFTSSIIFLVIILTGVKSKTNANEPGTDFSDEVYGDFR